MLGNKTYFDVSFTRTQGGTVGISRTVRRLFAELSEMGCRPIPVAFHSDGFRRVDAFPHQSLAESRPQNWLFRLVTGRFFRRVVAVALLIPWSILSRGWGLASSRIFNGLASGLEPVRFQPGSVLLMCDASWNYEAWVAVRDAKNQGAKVLLLVYDLIPVNEPRFCYRLTTLIFARWLDQMLRLADGVVCISRATQDEVRQWIVNHAISSPPPLGYFHLGSDFAPHGDSSARVRQFLTHGAPCFVAVGSIEPRKNHAQLLEAFETLWTSGSQARLLVAGKPTIDCEAFIRRLLRHPELGQRLLVAFDATDGEISYAYSHCRALVFPSLAEGFGLPLVEARACGCRVIASDLPVFREFADNDVHFFSAGSVDALVCALRSELARAPQQIRTSARGTSWAASAAQFVAVAQRLLA